MDSSERLIQLTRQAGTPRGRRLRRFRESLIKSLLFGCAIFSVITTVSIIVVLTSETLSFFRVNTSSVGSERVELGATEALAPDAKASYLGNWRLVDGRSDGGEHPTQIGEGDFVAVSTDEGPSLLLPATDVLAATGRTARESGDPAAVLSAFDELRTPGAADEAAGLSAWQEAGERTREVTPVAFLTGTSWNPLLGEEKQFGIWPLITGTLLITLIAAVFALPIGLVTAIFLSEYAPAPLRGVLKPILEILAGIPTVVYGFFALTVITPGLNWLSEFYNGLVDGTLLFDSYNAMAAGIAVGIMILPIVSSLAEDALRAVPRSLRDGAYALGSTRFDVSVRVVVPAALSGIMASFLLAITRAVGETMIVALAAGGLAQMAYDPTGPAQTMTAYMVQIFLGDAPATGVEYKSSYAVAAVLFIMTLILTISGNIILRRFREEYE